MAMMVSASCHTAQRPLSSEESTGKERDAETGLDYFGAGYYSAAQGRFTSPDPVLSSARLWDPQSWNRYVYARNNPLRFIDEDGLNYVDLTEKQRKLIDEWARRNYKGDEEDFSAQEIYDALSESERATTESVLGALESTKIIGADGSTMTALDAIGSIEIIKGAKEGTSGTEQFRLTTSLQDGAADSILTAKNFHRVPGHPGFPNSRQLDGGEPSIQFCISSDGRRADIDVDYESKSVVTNIFNGFKHLRPSNSDVRAAEHFDKHNQRFSEAPLKRQYDPKSK
jgi:RHS repeat-associated protein